MDARLNDAEWLREQYEAGRSLQDIADELRVHRNTIRNRFIEFDINRREKWAHLKGIPLSLEQRAKLSNARKAYWNLHPMTDNLRLKISKCRTKTGITKAGRRIYVVGQRRRILEHRLVMEKIIGRTLESYEQVHHIDGNRLNNNPNNLRLLTNSNHQKLHNVTRERDKSGRFIS